MGRERCGVGWAHGPKVGESHGGTHPPKSGTSSRGASPVASLLASRVANIVWREAVKKARFERES
jgi:hypothetical protein